MHATDISEKTTQHIQQLATSASPTAMSPFSPKVTSTPKQQRPSAKNKQATMHTIKKRKTAIVSKTKSRQLVTTVPVTVVADNSPTPGTFLPGKHVPA